MSTATRLVTADELLRLPRGRVRYELIRGELLTMSPAGSEHGTIIFRLSALIHHFISSKKLGLGFGAETGFLIQRNPDTVRAPDIAFVRADRIPVEGPPQGFWPGAPDLAVEVVSPGDTTREVDEKVAEWLQAGCRAVWIIDPHARTVSVHPAGGSSELLNAGQTLEGGSILPGFKCPVTEIFTVVSG
jgi:Uma2 family endonuclease